MIAYGYVKWFDAAKGYGFIATTMGDVFVHIDQIACKAVPSLGQRVSFSLSSGRRGLSATSVKFER